MSEAASPSADGPSNRGGRELSVTAANQVTRCRTARPQRTAYGSAGRPRPLDPVATNTRAVLWYGPPSASKILPAPLESMMRHLIFLTLTSALLLTLPGCAKDPLDTSGETAADGTTGGDTGGTTGAMDDGSADMDGGMTDAGSSSSSSSSSTDDGAAFLPDDTSSSTSGAPDPLPNGSQCGGDGECESGICNQPFPGFGICSDCRSDGDCQQSGDGVNCTLNDSGWYACSAGNLGEQCESDAGCGDPLTCEEIVNFGGIFGLTACSNCADTSECDADNVCAPVVMLDGFDLGGYRDCVAPGSIPNDSICDDNAEGDVACAGLCAPVDTGFAGPIGVCGDCETDADCAMGQTCAPGSLGQGGVAGNSCQ